jgi:RNA recognition motif-containing protein
VGRLFRPPACSYKSLEERDDLPLYNKSTTFKPFSNHLQEQHITIIKQETHTKDTNKQAQTIIMSANTVHVKNISSQTSEKDIKDFFSFW